jgi:hypothetical protein
MKDEYDFSKGVRGRYASRFKEGSIAVVLDPDVAEDFPNADAVNNALRALAAIIREREVASAKAPADAEQKTS